MTINSVAITKQARLNTATNEVRIPSTQQSGTVQLKIKANPLASRMVKSGVPLPYQGVSSTSELVVKNENGVEIPAQFDVLNYWPDGSICWVLVTVKASASPSSEKNYSLDWGATVTQSSYSTNLSYTEDANEIVVTTGKSKVTISKSSGIILSAFVDTAGDQSYTKQVLTTSDICTQDALTGTLYYAANEVAATVTVTRSGVNCIQIEAEGYTKDVSNNTYTKFQVWYDFYADEEFFDIDYTMIDDVPRDTKENFFITTSPVKFQAQNLSFKLNHSLSSNRKYIFGGETTVSSGNLTSEQYILQSGAIYYNSNAVYNQDPAGLSNDANGIVESYTGIQNGGRAKGYGTIHDGTAGVTTIIKDFWQRWPKEISLDLTTATMHLHPEKYHNGNMITQFSDDAQGFWQRPTTLWGIERGIAKTYEMRVILHNSAPISSSIENYVNDFNHDEPKLLCTAEQYCKTEASGFNIEPTDSNSIIYDDSLYNNTLIHSRNSQPHVVSATGDVDFGVHRRIGWSTDDPRKIAGWYDGTHFLPQNLIIMWFRTQRYEWLEQAFRESRHFMDRLICHSGFTSSPYTAINPLPAGMNLASSHYNLEHHASIHNGSHAHIAAMCEYYWLTGKPRVPKVMDEMREFEKVYIAYRWPNPRPANYNSSPSRPLGEREFVEAERDHGWSFYIANRISKFFNDADFHANYASDGARFLIDWWKEKTPHYLRDEIIGTIDWELGTGYWNMDKSDNSNKSFTTNGPSPWMSPSLFESCLNWYDNELKFNNSGINLLEFREMMYQCMQFVQYWGYREDKKEYKYAMDPETWLANGDSNGARQLMSPTARLYIMLLQDKAANNLGNPEWYDDALWRTRIDFYAARWKQTPFQLQQYGFYGYEFLYPHTFWKYLKEIEAL